MKRLALLPRTLEPTLAGPLNDALWHAHRYCADITVPCRDPNRDYSGRDPDIQFPGGWHVMAGFPLMPYRYHQSIAPGDFQPDRVRALRRKSWNGKERWCVRLIAGLPDRAGAAMLTRPFDREIYWEDGHPVWFSVRLMASSEKRATHFIQLEPRGWLDFQPKAEAYDGIGLSVWGGELNQLVVRWWSRGKTGDPIGARETAKLHHRLELDVWHHVMFKLVPTVMTNQWTARIEWNGQLIWETPDLFPVNGMRAVVGAAVGDEQSTRKDTRGGVWYVGRIQAWEVLK